VIRLGLRLTLRSGREATLRVLVTAAAAALGVGLLLAALAGMNGLEAQADRGAWLDTAAPSGPGAAPGRKVGPGAAVAERTQTPPTTTNASTSGRLWWLLTVDEFGTQAIDRVDVAAASPNAPVPPGLAHLPGPGDYYASPVLSSLIRSVPGNELRDRFPGRQVGTIGAAGLASPNSLVIVIGHTARQLSQLNGAVEVNAIRRTPATCYACQSGVGSKPILRFILAGGAIALLLPVLILIATASRLSAARREERFAAMRLVGATPHQVSVISAVEATVAAFAGVAIGFALFFAFRPLLTHVPFGGAPFAPGDLSLDAIDVALAVVGVPIAAVASARLALRRVQISPLGAVRRATPRAPRAFRLIPLLAGVALLAYFDAAGKPGAIGGQLLELLAGFALLIVGLVLAGPWFTTAGARVMVRRASSASALIAGRRLLDNPKAAFRFISGLVIALFVSSAVFGALSSISSKASVPSAGAGSETLADRFCAFTTSSCPASAEVPSVSARALAELRSTPGVTAVTVVHEVSRVSLQNAFGVLLCSQLAKTPAIGRCPPKATAVDVGYFLSSVLGHNSNASITTWPSARMSARAVARLPVDAMVVATNGSPGAFERARTALERAFPFQGVPVGVDALDPETERELLEIEDVTDVIIVASLLIAACSLAVNIAASLGERKRPFSLLRLAGLSTGLLHRVVALESALPLVLVAGVSIVVGFIAAALYLHSQVGMTFSIPGIAYWATVLGGLAASLAIIASTFPLLNRITGPDVARNE
jgi:hypothetical protein